MTRTTGKTVAVIGGGIIGLGIACEAIRRGHRVSVYDPDPATGATFAAAGMLAPVSELHYGEESLLALTMESARRYPELIQRLEAAGHETGYRSTETLVAAVDAADRRTLADLKATQIAHGLAVEEISLRQARSAEPMLGPHLSGVFRIPADRQVDPRLLASALLAEVAAEGTLERRAVTGVEVNDDGGAPAVSGINFADGGFVAADETVIANGLHSAQLAGLPPWLKLPLRPVYGDILRLRVPPRLRPLLTSTVRGIVRGFPVYLVPRSDGTLVIGATQRENGSAEVSAGGVYELLRNAQALVPAVAELELYESTCRARPATPDNAPLLGRAGGLPGLICATGFFRHGVLMTPIAASVCGDLIDGKPADPAFAPFTPDRFSGVPE